MVIQQRTQDSVLLHPYPHNSSRVDAVVDADTFVVGEEARGQQ